MFLKRQIPIWGVTMIINMITADRTLINTTTGPIKGKIVDEYGVQYYSYQGIPYAENPTGELRFKPPVPVTPWTEVKDTTSEGLVCPQPESPYIREQMSENCLLLNVYVPAYPEETGALPVLVVIHGGDFYKLSGNPDYVLGPQLLLKHDIIIVTVNYRIGALGFLSLGIEEASGNAGLKDVLLALKWVNANICKFGGDGANITIGGNSAGGSIAHYLMLTEKSKGLFHRSILISGSALIFRHFAQNPDDFAMALAKQIGIQSNDSTEVVQELRKVDVFDIVQAQQALGIGYKRKGFITFAPFVPTKEIEYDNAFITQTPLQIIRAGIPQNVPVIVGTNTDEGIKMIPYVMEDPNLVDYLNEDFELCIPTDIEYPYGSQESISLASRIRQFCLDGAYISNSTLNHYVEQITDSTFDYGIDDWLKIHLKRPDSNKVFYYRFGFDGELNWFKLTQNLDFPGTAHADDVGYLFVTNITKSMLDKIDSRSLQMVETMTTVMTNFVKFANPTPHKNDIGVIWSEADERRNHLLIGNESVKNIHEAPIMKRLNFWYNVYAEYGQYLENGGIIKHKGFCDIEYLQNGVN